MSEIESKAITYLRVVAMFMIIGCHVIPYSFISNMLSVGVQIFLIISAYIYGKRNIASGQGYAKWLRSRAKRLLPPMYAVVLFILIVNFIQGNVILWVHSEI